MFKRIVEKQRNYFFSEATKSIEFRIEHIQKLKSLIQKNEDKIVQALHKDLRKPKYESYISEILFVYEEINHTLKNIKKWAKHKNVPTPLHLQPGTAHIMAEPFGVVGIFAPWNYPFQLLISPLIGAMAAGNCAILKPADLSSHTQAVILDLINNCFNEQYIYAIGGGVAESEKLLEENLDFIFFTGSPRVGKIIMSAAAKNLTPVCLELGGKSPCIVDGTANLEVAARKIIWAKFLNAGQTCVAPDYIYVEKSVATKLKDLLVKEILESYGEDPKVSPDFCRIISSAHYERLNRLIVKEKVVHGGDTDSSEKYISPTLLSHVKWTDEVMKDEIFGPILPILEFENLQNVIEEIKSRPKPLALYYYSSDSKNINQVLVQTSSGGVCINDCVIHLGNPNLPFGGVGNSGMNHYHGKFSFDLFSHHKSVHKSSTLFEIPFRKPPYSESLLKLLRKYI